MTWITNIPASTDILSVSQGELQGNNNANETAFGIDHVAFTLADAGQHNQVTFNANNVPTPPVAPPVLFTNTVAPITTPELFFYSGTQAQSGDQYVLGSLASNKGSVLLMGGIILKWFNGTLTTPTQEFDFTAGTGIVVGLNDFPNGVQGAVVTTQNFVSPSGYTVGYQALDKTKIIVQRNPGAGGSTNVFVLVIGY